jgi:hypothetical protein
MRCFGASSGPRLKCPFRARIRFAESLAICPGQAAGLRGRKGRLNDHKHMMGQLREGGQIWLRSAD